MGTSKSLEEGRAAFAAGQWTAASDALLEAFESAPLDGDDLWRLALASYLIGREDDFVRALVAAHRASADSGDAVGAVRAAFWLGQHLAAIGEHARAGGWFGRSARAAESAGSDGPGPGYVLLQTGHQKLIEGEYEASVRACAAAAAIGERTADRDLTAIALHAQGRALIRMGRLDEGLAMLDEAMVAVTTSELSPVATGLIYCSVLSACREVHALHRAKEWTAALSEWCERQPDMVAYSGECRVSRAEIHLRRGEWEHAVEEARQAQQRLQRFGPGSAGAAFYQEGEVHRLRGELAAAEEAYRAASRAGYEPQPGLGLLRLAQGDGETAEAAVRRALAETASPLRRARLLPAYVEILLAVDALEEARSACDELTDIAHRWGGSVLEAIAAQARGALLLRGGSAAESLGLLRRACQEWDSLEAPYEAARIRVLLASACAALGDQDGAALELETAEAELRRLGAASELSKLHVDRGAKKDRRHGLTRRELEVLSCLATGLTNRQIGKELFISEKTVARHLANIYTKLGLSSRAAATAYAYEHGLLDPPA